jgi:SpoVK/Ycf46/Vps4 family AAA+-type ATPase
MENIDHALLDLVRLGLAADAQSVRLYARRLLQRPPKGVADADGFRENLTALLAQGANERALRTAPTSTSPAPRHKGSPRPAVPIEQDSRLSLLQGPTSDYVPEPVLEPSPRGAIEAVIAEREQGAALRASGVEPTKTLLLTGPPGVGKTMTARYLAHRAKLPLLIVDLAAVVSSYLGRTGQNLRQLLDHARATPCALLLDEFDALAKRRDDASDVGELKRIVNVLLLELESWPAESLLIAATNHPDLLDPAVWRRFDRVIELGLPTREARQRMLETVFREGKIPIGPEALTLAVLATDGASGSDAIRFARSAVRDAVLAARTTADQSLLDLTRTMVLTEGERSPQKRQAFCRAASATGLFTQRQLGDLLGVSHVTVGRWLRGDRADRSAPVVTT